MENRKILYFLFLDIVYFSYILFLIQKPFQISLNKTSSILCITLSEQSSLKTVFPKTHFYEHLERYVPGKDARGRYNCEGGKRIPIGPDNVLPDGLV